MVAKKMKLAAGPFWGEFGWEVAQWIPWLNAYINRNKPETVRIGCQPHMGPLYELAFPKATISNLFPRPDKADPDMVHAWKPNKAGRRRAKESMALAGATKWLSPSEANPVTGPKGVPVIHGDLDPIEFGKELVRREDRMVCLHTRNIRLHPERNLSEDTWLSFLDAIQDDVDVVNFIGGPKDWFPPPHIVNDRELGVKLVDYRHRSIAMKVDLLRESLMCIGPSSGPMHLAQMCKCPVMFWSGNSHKDRPRYGSVWNHFNSTYHFAADTWSPSVDTLAEQWQSARFTELVINKARC